MALINEIGLKQINSLNDIQLTELLHKLIKIEAEKNKLENWDRHVPFDITTGDAGSDGRITWNGNPPMTNWLKNPFTIFQNKATNLQPKQCKEEILEPEEDKKPRKLKSQIENLVNKNGCYVLFTTQSLNDKQKKLRIDQFREAIKLAGHKNYNTFQILIYDANKIKDWANENIAAVTLIQSYNGITRPQGFIIWEEWEKLVNASKNEFFTNKIVTTNIEQILQTIRTQKALRISGHSGLGKTRLVLESFRNDDLKSFLVYCDIAGSNDISEIKNYILSHQNSQEGIIVIDNCESKYHLILSALVNGDGKLKIITIGFDDNPSIEDAKIKIERNNQRDVVRQIVDDRLSLSHSPSDREYVNKLSEGYPWMAIKFCDAVIKQALSELNSYPLEDFIKKLLFGTKPENDIEYNIIRACAVFSAFGFPDDSFREVINADLRKSLKNQTEFIRTKVYDGQLSDTKFRETILKFTREDIIERRGTFLIVRPTILAVNLAANWLINTDYDKIIDIIKELKDVGLDERFFERFKDLDQIDKAKEIVAELWGPRSPFGSAEVLNTSWGSLLFRYVVEVNPGATASALEHAFSNLTKAQMLQITEGRRNLVWALEKLCFRRETFEKAAKILYSFAVAENESWANNSTNQFKHLFQVHLPGTEASFNERLSIINWGLAKNDGDYTQIAINALSYGLRYEGFFRSGGPEIQGSGPILKDYVPKTWKEIFDYWNQIIRILSNLACANDENSEMAAMAIVNSIRTLIAHGQHNLIIDAIRKTTICQGSIWLGAVNNLKQTVSYEKHLEPEIIALINSLISELTPLDLEHQILLKVSKPEWDSYEIGDDGHYVDKPKINAEAFAVELHDKSVDWFIYIKNILTGEQRQAFNFGKKIGEIYPNVEEVVRLSIMELGKIEKKAQNPEFIAGLLSAINKREVIIKLLDSILQDDLINQYSFYFFRIINPTFSDIEKLFFLVDKKGFSISQFENFKYGRALDNLSKDEVVFLCEKISEYGHSGVWTSLSLLFMFDLDHEDNWKSNKVLVNKLIASNNLLLHLPEFDTMASYYWSEFVKKILNENKEAAFAKKITEQIIEQSSQEILGYSSDSHITSILDLILKKYFNEVWLVIGDAIISNSLSYLRLKHLIGARNGWHESEGILFSDEEHYEEIIKWCKKHPEIAPKRIANMMPLSKDRDGKSQWHPIAKAIIDEFGNNSAVLAELSANMGTFGYTGSVVPYYTSLQILVRELLNHPLENVRKWAEKKLEYFEKTIKKERLDDEEWHLR
ncbi:MAG TPA: hypothetical protein VGN63_04220 [Flavisolibacter sp.]|jgi:hypothetical protein|nr:hypothetical protein [Flavisolibacter sp.]